MVEWASCGVVRLVMADGRRLHGCFRGLALADGRMHMDHMDMRRLSKQSISTKTFQFNWSCLVLSYRVLSCLEVYRMYSYSPCGAVVLFLDGVWKELG